MPSRLHVSRCVFRQLIKTNLIKYKKAIVDIAPQYGVRHTVVCKIQGFQDTFKLGIHLYSFQSDVQVKQSCDFS